MMIDLVNLIKTNNVEVVLTHNGTIRCVKGYKFPDGVVRLIYKNYNIECKNMSRIKFCIKEFLKFYEQTVKEIQEEGFDVEDLT